MALSIVYKPVGQTAALSVTASAHTPVAVTAAPSEPGMLFAGLLNPAASVSVFVSFQPLSQTGTAAALSAANTPVFPIDGTPSAVTGVLLPPLMQQPLVVPVPAGNGGFAVTGIGSGAGPTIIYVTPMTAQS